MAWYYDSLNSRNRWRVTYLNRKKQPCRIHGVAAISEWEAWSSAVELININGGTAEKYDITVLSAEPDPNAIPRIDFVPSTDRLIEDF